MAEKSDAELVDQARAGDRAAFAELVRRYRPQLLRVVRRYLSDEDDAEDVTQRSLVRSFDALADLRQPELFAGWLCRIGIRLALNQLRDQKRLAPLSLEDTDLITNSLATGRLVAREARQRLASFLQELPARQRVAVELRLLEDLSFREIAELMGGTQELAKANYHHGIKRLRAALDSD